MSFWSRVIMPLTWLPVGVLISDTLATVHRVTPLDYLEQNEQEQPQPQFTSLSQPPPSTPPSSPSSPSSTPANAPAPASSSSFYLVQRSIRPERFKPGDLVAVRLPDGSATVLRRLLATPGYSVQPRASKLNPGEPSCCSSDDDNSKCSHKHGHKHDQSLFQDYGHNHDDEHNHHHHHQAHDHSHHHNAHDHSHHQSHQRAQHPHPNSPAAQETIYVPNGFVWVEPDVPPSVSPASTASTASSDAPLATSQDRKHQEHIAVDGKIPIALIAGRATHHLPSCQPVVSDPTFAAARIFPASKSPSRTPTHRKPPQSLPTSIHGQQSAEHELNAK